MFVYLKESELHRKIFINKSFNHETVRLLFDKETPVHEVKSEDLAKLIVNSFPVYLNYEEKIPAFLSKKEEKVEEKPAEPVPFPTPVEQPVVESKEEPEVEKVEESPVELSPIEKVAAAQESLEEKEKSKRGRKKKEADE